MATGFRATIEVELSPTLTLHCDIAGNGAIPIVFIPGWSMSSAVFERQLAHFATSDTYRAIAYDPRGQGQSSKPLDGHFYDQRGRDLAALMAALDLKKVIPAGWSYGVLDMLAYVRGHGVSNLRAAIAIDGAPRGLGADSAKEWVWESPAQHIAASSVLRTLETRAAVNRELARWCLEATDEEDLRRLEAIVAQTPDTIAALINEAAIYSNYEAELSRLCSERPALIVARDDWREAVTGWTAAHAPAARLAIFGKHMMFWDRAARFNALLDDFLEDFVG